ncbi:ANTAR domain-containing response regulator [Salinithrix halophila]|uniref:ANTAR domain-containing response regulator n=1 Tax=Salinithrix halophila TaxID=1485204 RepID=A0ABV8JDS6_9BACL
MIQRLILLSEKPSGQFPDTFHHMLTRAGLHVLKKLASEEIQPKGEADAIVLAIPVDRLTEYHPSKDLPLLWCCDGRDPHQLSVKHFSPPDGLLFPGMDANQIHWALRFSAERHQRRLRLARENERLTRKLEERKWIDQAKGILCQAKSLSEPEAYQLLRKHAMNERRRIADVAASIVNVYQLLDDKK